MILPKMYLLYDERAVHDVDAATVLDTCDTKQEAIQSRKEFFPGAVIFEYDYKDGQIINGRQISMP